MVGRTTSRRSMLAFIWSIINILTAISFIVAFLFTYSSANNVAEDYNDNEQNGGRIIQVSVTSRGMAFSWLWTAVLAAILAMFGTIVLGVQSPTGEYYACCLGTVHETTPTSIGSFIGSLIMFANLTFVCALLFGEFEVRDYYREGQDMDGEEINGYDNAADRSSSAFSIVCIIMSIMYAAFAALVYNFSNSILEENLADAQLEAMPPSNADRIGGVSFHPSFGIQAQPGYLGGEQFDITSLGKTVEGGFVTQQSDSSI